MRLWSFILIFALAIGLGAIIRQDPGYALFSYGNWSIEMPLWLSILFLVLIVASILSLLWFINTVFSSSHKVKYWWKKHQTHIARSQTYRGLLALTEGRWEKAERYLIKSASHNDTPLINYLSAAQAAEENGSPERRDHYLQLAFDVGAGSEIAVRLTQAHLQFKHGEIEKSIETLKLLQKQTPKHPKVLRLLCTLHEATNDWQSLFYLLPELKKTEAISKETIERLEQKIYSTLLPTYANQGLESLIAFWKKSPASVQNNPEAVYSYAKLLIEKSEHNQAEILLRSTLKKSWNKNLIHLYGLTQSHPKKQLSFAESFLPSHSEDSTLFLTLGRICLYSQLWGKARSYLERSLTLAPHPETYAELGQLLETLGHPEKSEEYYKKGLLLATQNSSFLEKDISQKTELLSLPNAEL